MLHRRTFASRTGIDMNGVNILDTLIGFIVGGGLLSLITIKAGKRKAEAEADASVADNYEKYTQRIEARLDQTEHKVDRLTEQNAMQYKAIMAAFGCKLHSSNPGSVCPVQEVYEQNKSDE